MANTGNKHSQTFEQLLRPLGYQYDLPIVFSDLLTMTLCAFAQNPATGLSYDEDIYLQTVAKYDKPTASAFAQALAALINEMEQRIDSSTGNDVLGEFYELNLTQRNRSQFFTPWPICMLLAQCTAVPPPSEQQGPLRVLEPACGSGRMLLAAAKTLGPQHRFFGIDIDLTCIKMAAMNLFLNGVFHAELMCANALDPSDFRVSYRTSFLPFGVFRIDKAENSPLWNMMQAGLVTKPAQAVSSHSLLLSSEDPTIGNYGDKGAQLHLF